MPSKEYHIKVHSTSRFIIVLMVIIPLHLIPTIKYLPNPDNEISFFIMGFLLITSSAYITHLITFGKIRLIITDKGIKHIWIKRFMFNKEPNFLIPWKRIIDFETKYYQLFNHTFINLTKDTRYKINRCNAFLIRDDFKAFVHDFPELLQEHRKDLQS